MITPECKAVAQSNAVHLQSGSWPLTEYTVLDGSWRPQKGDITCSQRWQICFWVPVSSEKLWLHDEENYTTYKPCCHPKFCSRKIRGVWRGYFATADFVPIKLFSRLQKFVTINYMSFLHLDAKLFGAVLCIFHSFIKHSIPNAFWCSPESPTEY